MAELNMNGKKIKDAAKLEAYVVSYVDARGKDAVRIVFVPEGKDEQVFILRDKLQKNSALVANATAWFTKAVRKFVGGGSGPATPKTGVESI